MEKEQIMNAATKEFCIQPFLFKLLARKLRRFAINRYFCGLKSLRL